LIGLGKKLYDDHQKKKADEKTKEREAQMMKHSRMVNSNENRQYPDFINVPKETDEMRELRIKKKILQDEGINADAMSESEINDYFKMH
jgi:hypothetical protein